MDGVRKEVRVLLVWDSFGVCAHRLRLSLRPVLGREYSPDPERPSSLQGVWVTVGSKFTHSAHPHRAPTVC